MALEFYGIPNCDTVKKARKWLEAEGHEYNFRDYKKEGANPAELSKWADQLGWEVLLNKRGTTFRKLSEADKSDIDQTKAVKLMAANPSMIKRPVVVHSGGLLVGFKLEEWDKVL
ncbi:MAG: ArsC family reductase [Erythrobacter sp.]